MMDITDRERTLWRYVGLGLISGMAFGAAFAWAFWRFFGGC